MSRIYAPGGSVNLADFSVAHVVDTGVGGAKPWGLRFETSQQDPDTDYQETVGAWASEAAAATAAELPMERAGWVRWPDFNYWYDPSRVARVVPHPTGVEVVFDDANSLTLNDDEIFFSAED